MAAVSPTDIANLAVGHVGDRSIIENLLTDSSEAARQCRLWYDLSREQVLEAFNWNFARRRLSLALHGDVISGISTDPLAGVWRFRYQYPADCIKIRKIQNPNSPPDDSLPFDVELDLKGETKSILTDQEDAVLVYTMNLKSPELFSPTFVQALSHLLASKIAFSLTGKRKVATDNASLYGTVVQSAAVLSVDEKMDPPPRDAEWVRAR